MPPDIHADCPVPWERLEAKIDRLDDRLDALRETAAADAAACRERHHALDATVVDARARMTHLEERAEANDIQRAGWLGSWRALVVVAAAVAAIAGLVISVIK